MRIENAEYGSFIVMDLNITYRFTKVCFVWLSFTLFVSINRSISLNPLNTFLYNHILGRPQL